MTHSFPTRRSSDLYRRAHQYERNRSRRLAFVSPCVPVSLLHGDIAGMQLHLRSIVELQPDPALYDNVIVNGLRSMHAGTVGFEQLCQPRKMPKLLAVRLARVEAVPENHRRGRE